MSYIVKAGKGDACDYKDVRSANDGKAAKLGYDSDTEPGDGAVMAPGGEASRDIDYRTSKWQGDGQKARHNG